MLKVENLDFSYKDEKVLDMIDFYLEEEDFIGIIGPNGSGKSTLLKNISKLLEPEKGSIILDNNLLNNYSYKELARKMAVVPQDTNISFNFSVYDLVMMGRNPYQDRWGRVSTEDKKKVKEAMELTEITEFKDKSVQNLSGGERQRVIIARAIVQEPDLLLLDEPTASLDINYQRNIFDLISDLNKKLEMSVLAVSHDLNLISQYADKLILLYKGKIFKMGTVEEVITKSNISKVYNTEVDIKYNPMTNRPYVIIVPRKKGKKTVKENRFSIHLVCGGGTGKEIMNYLDKYQIGVSCGVLNRGDTDWEEAKRLDYKVIEIPPFAPIDQKAIESVKEEITKSDMVIVANTPFGWGNIDNIKVLKKIKNKEIIFLIEDDINNRDFTEGKAASVIEKIKEKNKIFKVDSIKKLFDFIKQKYEENIYD